MVQINQLINFEFGFFILDPNAIRLMKQGQAIEVETQVFETMLLLVKNRERVVTKDELIQAVWHGRLVTDNVITRTIYKIRKIVDVTDDKQSIIRTVRGKGYQFTADVKIVPGLIHNKNEPIKFKKTRTVLSLFLILLVILGFILWYQNQQSFDTNISGSSTVPHQIIVVMPIYTEGSSEELTILTQSVVDYLAIQLSLNLGMKVIHPDSISMLKAQLNDIWSIQKATRAHIIIEGFLESVSGTTIKIHLTLHKKNEINELTPYALGSFEFPYPHTTKDLNDLYKQRKITVNEIINLIIPGIIINDDGESETDDPEAYRMVIAAHHIMRSDSCQDIYRAEKLLINATERDPGFAHAWNQLFSNYFKRIWVCGESADNYQEALKVAGIVEQLAPNKYKTVAVARNGFLIENNQVEEAYDYVKDVNRNDPEALYMKVYALRYAGFLNLASQDLDRILQLYPFYFSEKPIHRAPNTLLYLNRFEDHLVLLAEPGNAYHDYYRGLNLVLNDKVNDANTVLQETVNRTPNDLFGQFSSALLYILANQKDESIKIIDSIVKNRLEKKHSDGEMTYKLAQLYALSGAIQKALSQFQLAVDQGFFPFSYFKHDPALAVIRNELVFKGIIEQAQLRHIEFAKRFNLPTEVN